MSARDIVVIGGSAGGLQSLRELLGALPRDLPAACLAVLHVPGDRESAADRILQHAGTSRCASPKTRSPSAMARCRSLLPIVTSSCEATGWAARDTGNAAREAACALTVV